MLLFPILRLEYKVTVDEWRGALAPKDPAAWWASYGQLIRELAGLAKAEGVAALAIGSELATQDTDPRPWRPLIASVRRRFPGKLVYSANWDHYRRVAIWHLVDIAGISAYFQLSGPARQRPAPLERLVHGWREHRVEITRWWVRTRKPLIFTELGYLSQRNSSARPWDEAAKGPLDLEEQARCLLAFFRAWQGAAFLAGAYVWNWYGWGGPSSREYTPRGKPAATELCRWYGAQPGRCPRSFGLPAPR